MYEHEDIIDPQGPAVRPHFSKSRKQSSSEIVVATPVNVGLAEWIIDSARVLFYMCQASMELTCLIIVKKYLMYF